MKARKLATLKGKPVFEFPVELTFGEHASIHQVNHYPKHILKVIAHTARDAGYFAKDLFPTTPCLEVEVYGPRGGVAWHSWQGWETAIGNAMWQTRSNQLQLC